MSIFVFGSSFAMLITKYFYHFDRPLTFNSRCGDGVSDQQCDQEQPDLGEECLPCTSQPPPPSVATSSPGGLRGVVAEGNDMARYDSESFPVKMEMGIALIYFCSPPYVCLYDKEKV